MVSSYKPKMANSARYQIFVQGRVNPKWSGRLGGLTVSSLVQEDGSTITKLEGELMDQSALLGVLNSLSNFQFPLISVRFVCTDEKQQYENQQ